MGSEVKQPSTNAMNALYKLLVRPSDLLTKNHDIEPTGYMIRVLYGPISSALKPNGHEDPIEAL